MAIMRARAETIEGLALLPINTIGESAGGSTLAKIYGDAAGDIYTDPEALATAFGKGYNRFYKVGRNVQYNLRKYIGFVGGVVEDSDIQDPFLMLDFGHGRTMAFHPEELVESNWAHFHPSKKMQGDCIEPGCFEEHHSRGFCRRHYAAHRYRERAENVKEFCDE